MMGVTHLEGAAAAWLAGCVIVRPEPKVVGLGLAVALVAALAVDTDHRQSWAAQFLRGIGVAGGIASLAAFGVNWWWLALSAGVFSLPYLTRPHDGRRFRGVLHSLWAVIALAAAGLVALPWVPLWVVLAAWVGWGSHLALDALTREGLPLLWPDRSRWAVLPRELSMRTGGKRRGKGKGRVGLEYKLVQPALGVALVGLGWLVLLNGGAA